MQISTTHANQQKGAVVTSIDGKAWKIVNKEKLPIEENDLLSYKDQIHLESDSDMSVLLYKPGTGISIDLSLPTGYRGELYPTQNISNVGSYHLNTVSGSSVRSESGCLLLSTTRLPIVDSQFKLNTRQCYFSDVSDIHYVIINSEGNSVHKETSLDLTTKSLKAGEYKLTIYKSNAIYHEMVFEAVKYEIYLEETMDAFYKSGNTVLTDNEKIISILLSKGYLLEALNNIDNMTDKKMNINPKLLERSRIILESFSRSQN